MRPNRMPTNARPRKSCTAEKSCGFFFAKPLDKLSNMWYYARARGIIRARKYQILILFHATVTFEQSACRFDKRFFFGAPAENRTPDTMIKSHVLYQLSYRGICLHHNIIAYQEKFVNPFFKVLIQEPHRRRFYPPPVRWLSLHFNQIPYFAPIPSAFSMRRRRLYLATRSLRQGAPVLIYGALVPTARSAMVVSSVSPER